MDESTKTPFFTDALIESILKVSNKYDAEGLLVILTKPVPGIDDDFVVLTKDHYNKLTKGTK